MLKYLAKSAKILPVRQKRLRTFRGVNRSLLVNHDGLGRPRIAKPQVEQIQNARTIPRARTIRAKLPENPASGSSVVSSGLSGLSRAWALRANFANGRTYCGSAIDHGNLASARDRTGPSISVNVCARQHRIVLPRRLLVNRGQYVGTALYSPTRVERTVR